MESPLPGPEARSTCYDAGSLLPGNRGQRRTDDTRLFANLLPPHRVIQPFHRQKFVMPARLDDGTAFQPVAKYQIPEAIWVYMQQHTPPSFVRLASGERFVHIADLRQDAAYQSDFTRDLRRLGLDMVRSLLIVPLRKNDALLGLIVAYSQEVRPFSNKQPRNSGLERQCGRLRDRSPSRN